ncbi:hypothetical protein HYQ46_006873 [Verticillium longisporum]|nr:hypothetical protein HYQ46_006873 [Verticillium longisporum]
MGLHKTNTRNGLILRRSRSMALLTERVKFINVFEGADPAVAGVESGIVCKAAAVFKMGEDMVSGCADYAFRRMLLDKM